MLSDSCSEFQWKVQDAALTLAQEARSYQEWPFEYGPEVDAITALAQRASADPMDEEAAAKLILLAGAVQRYHDTMPGNPDAESRRRVMLRLSAHSRGINDNLPILMVEAVGVMLAGFLFRTPSES